MQTRWLTLLRGFILVTLPLCGSCGEIIPLPRETCEALDLNRDPNVFPVLFGDPPSSARRVVRPGDTWDFHVYQNQSDFIGSWVMVGRRHAEVTDEVVLDAIGAETNVVTWDEVVTDCLSRQRLASSFDTYFTQDESGLLWVHGYNSEVQEGSSRSFVIDPVEGKFFRTPAVLEVGAENHVTVTYHNGLIERYDDRIVAIDDVETELGRLRAFRIERVYSAERQGRIDLVAHRTEWFVPEIGENVRSRATITDYFGDRNFQTWVILNQLYATNVPLPPTNTTPPIDENAPDAPGAP